MTDDPRSDPPIPHGARCVASSESSAHPASEGNWPPSVRSEMHSHAAISSPSRRATNRAPKRAHDAVDRHTCYGWLTGTRDPMQGATIDGVVDFLTRRIAELLRSDRLCVARASGECPRGARNRQGTRDSLVRYLPGLHLAPAFAVRTAAPASSLSWPEQDPVDVPGSLPGRLFAVSKEVRRRADAVLDDSDNRPSLDDPRDRSRLAWGSLCMRPQEVVGSQAPPGHRWRRDGR